MTRTIALTIAATALLGLVLAPDAMAKAERTVSYSAEVVWPTAVRHIRVDEGHEIVDKDAETGYVLFEVVDGGKSYRGALELVSLNKDDDGDSPRVKLILRIDDRPEYMETAILERLEKKLRSERR